MFWAIDIAVRLYSGYIRILSGQLTTNCQKFYETGNFILKCVMVVKTNQNYYNYVRMGTIGG